MNTRDKIYYREAAFFDQESLESRKDLGFVYGGFGINLAIEQLYRFAGAIQGKRVLEYGCGNGENLLDIAHQGAWVTGIELSRQSVARADRLLKQQKIATRAVAVPMNAEVLGFKDNTFDVVMGTAVLHHLDLTLALPEIHRVLKPGGVGTFLEARGSNFFVNLYRKLTPTKRTPDEHPLVQSDFRLLEAGFKQVKIVNFYLLALFSFIVRKIWKNEKAFVALNRFLTEIDHRLVKIFPFLDRFCWIAVIQVTKIE